MYGIFKLLYNYAANAKTKLGGKSNLLESCLGAGSFMFGGYFWHLGSLAPFLLS